MNSNDDILKYHDILHFMYLYFLHLWGSGINLQAFYCLCIRVCFENLYVIYIYIYIYIIVIEGSNYNYFNLFHLISSKLVQGGSNMTGTDLCVNKPHCAAAVRP